MTEDQKNRAKGAFFGLLVGDALGVPYEFHAPEEIPVRRWRRLGATPEFLLDERGAAIGQFERAHRGTPEGTWSDDGALALALAEALAHAPRDPAHDALARRFARNALAWRWEGSFTPDGRVFDVGGTTDAALRRLEAGVVPLEAGATELETNGNGSLMRTAPIAILEAGRFSSENELAMKAQAISGVTHAHELSRLSCSLFTLALTWVIEGQKFDEAVAMARDAHASDEAFLEALDRARVNGSGFVLSTLRAALGIASHAEDFEDAVQTAIDLGHDTDTTAAVVGALAGAKFGFTGIHPRTLKELKGKPLADLIFAQLWEARRYPARSVGPVE